MWLYYKTNKSNLFITTDYTINLSMVLAFKVLIIACVGHAGRMGR